MAASNGLVAEELDMPPQLPVPAAMMPDPTLNNAAAFAMLPGAPAAMSLFGGRGIRNSTVAQNIAFSAPGGYPLVAGFPFSPLVAPSAFNAASQPIFNNVMYHQDVGPMIYSSPASNSALQPCLVSSMGSYAAGGCPCLFQQPCGLHSALGASTVASQNGLLSGAQPSTAYRNVAPPPLEAPAQMPSSAQYVGHLPSSFRGGRMKRSAPTATTPSSSGRSQMPKVRRVAPLNGRPEEEVLFDALPGGSEATVPPSADRRTCNACGCQRTPSCLSCGCHSHPFSLHPHMNLCGCSTASQSSTATPMASNSPLQPVPRRETFDISAAQHSVLLARRAQIERERISNNAFYQRQQEALRRHHQVLLLPHHPQFLTVVSGETLLFPGGAGSLIAAAAGHMNGERPPVGASIEEIQKCTEKVPFVKEAGVPEEEEERCTVCLMNFESGEELRSLQCSHLFHVDCIDRWLIYNKTCPVCRLEIDNSKAVVAEESEPVVQEQLAI
uniref:RING-type domain-containing protein n=2 Tax=Steinernema glaseri TaxID=37863 RepID=A0A1I8A4V5_9BILA